MIYNVIKFNDFNKKNITINFQIINGDVMRSILWIYGSALAFGFALFGFWIGSILLVTITGNPSGFVFITGGIIGALIGILIGFSAAIKSETMRKAKKQPSDNREKPKK